MSAARLNEGKDSKSITEKAPSIAFMLFPFNGQGV
jgi:hypothetical protein